MKTTSSRVLKGVVIGIILLVIVLAWRAARQGRSTAAPPAHDGAADTSAAASPPPPVPQHSRLTIPAEGSVEFTQQLKRPHDPWKDRTDPDKVWEGQREKARELLNQLDTPPPEK